MAKCFRLVAEVFDSTTDAVFERTLVTEKTLKPLKNITELGFTHKEQIELLQKSQDSFLNQQSNFLQPPIDTCPDCSTKLNKTGFQEADFHSVFTDHRVKVRRLKCPTCRKTTVSSIQSLFGTPIHPDLVKMHCELTANHSYPEVSNILTLQSCGYRRINNQDRIRQNIALIGDGIARIICPIENAGGDPDKTTRGVDDESITDSTNTPVNNPANISITQNPSPESKQPATELYLNVDGGHVLYKDGTATEPCLMLLIYAANLACLANTWPHNFGRVFV